MANPAKGSQRPRTSADESAAPTTRAGEDVSTRTGRSARPMTSGGTTPARSGSTGHPTAGHTTDRTLNPGARRTTPAAAPATGKPAAARPARVPSATRARVTDARDTNPRSTDQRRTDPRRSDPGRIGGPAVGDAPGGNPRGRGDWPWRNLNTVRGAATELRPYREFFATPGTSPARRRMLARRRRSLVFLVLLVAAVMLGVDALAGADDEAPRPATAPARPVATRAAPTAPVLKPQVQVSASVPAPARTTAPARPTTATKARPAGAGFGYADSPGPVLGTAGTLRRFRVAVEKGAGPDANRFAAAIDTVLGDPRSWIAAKGLRLQRVPRAGAADFTIWLATAATSQRMCLSGGLHTEGYTSCRLPGHVVINLDRWNEAVPGYGAPLATYRAYAINHEVGHELGQGHEACTGPGRPAPVMQQQTYGLKGCVANPWPYLDGRRYTGPPVP